jgi:hypothetical protein
MPGPERLTDDLILILVLSGFLLLLCLMTWIARLMGFDDRE